MIDIMKLFYTTHYNLGALALLMLLLLIFFLSKKNFKAAIIVTALLVAYNVMIYKKTEGKSWTIEIEPEQTESNGYSSYYGKPDPIKLTFTAAPGKWTFTNEKGVTYHWCWVDDLWDKFASTDLVAWIWGENASKKMMKSTESRATEAQGDD